MARFFEMPQASPTMEAGTLLAWKRKEGDALKPQDAIAEVETDKAAMDVEVFDNCFLLKILAAEGDEIPAGQPIAILGASPDEDITALVAAFEARKAAGGSAVQTSAAPPVAQAPAAPAAPTAPAAPPREATRSSRGGFIPWRWEGRALDPSVLEPDVTWEPATPRLRASPAARKAGRDLGVDLGDVDGTGPRGRVTRADVERAASRPAAAPTAAEAPQAETSVRNSQMRKTIARRLKAVWQDAPVFYLTANLASDRVVDFRAQLKDAGLKVSFNDILIKAAARALRDVPAVNASWGEDAIVRHGGVHIGVAVALPDGLITPVIRDADVKGLGAIADEVRALASRAKDLKLAPAEYQGSTFTISNLGMMGIEQFTAIINPPEVCILAVGALQQEPVAEDGALAVRWRMRVTMTCDHRAVDGATGARFLEALRRYWEHPALLAG